MSEHKHALAAGQQATAEQHPSGMAKVGHTPADEVALEKELQAKGLNAPRLTPDLINATIVDEDYHVFPGTTLTVCCLKLRNGFTVTGESAAASPENFDQEVGRKIARENARNKIWAFEGYLLRERLHVIGPGQ